MPGATPSSTRSSHRSGATPPADRCRSSASSRAAPIMVPVRSPPFATPTRRRRNPPTALTPASNSHLANERPSSEPPQPRCTSVCRSGATRPAGKTHRRTLTGIRRPWSQWRRLTHCPSRQLTRNSPGWSMPSDPYLLSGDRAGLALSSRSLSRSNDSTKRAVSTDRADFLYVFKAALNGPHAPPPGRASDPSLSRSGPATPSPVGWRGEREAQGAAADGSAEGR